MLAETIKGIKIKFKDCICGTYLVLIRKVSSVKLLINKIAYIMIGGILFYMYRNVCMKIR